MDAEEREKIRDELKNAPIIKREKLSECADLLTFKGGRRAIFKPANREHLKKQKGEK